MTRCLVNGELHDEVAVTDRGLAYGDGVFETVAIRAGRARFLDRHLRRLTAGCARLGFVAPDAELLSAELERARGNEQRGTAKIVVTRGRGQRGYAPPAAAVPTRIITMSAESPKTGQNASAGVHVRLCALRLGHSPALAGIKTLNRLEQVLARSEWADPDISEGLLFDQSGALVCGTMTNVFLRQGNRLATPDLSNCGIRGVMRDVVFEAAASLSLQVDTRRVLAGDLEAAQEVFLTNSLIGIWPVTRCGQRDLPVGDMTQRLMSVLASWGVEECAA